MRDRVIQLIRSSGLSRVAGNIVDLAWDSLRLETAPLATSSVAGSSRLGGAPDLPPGFGWPEWKGVPMSLIAQLNMVEAGCHRIEPDMPSTGILYFFYAASSEQMPWGFDPKDRGGWKVVYYDGPMEALTPAQLPEGIPEDARFQPCSVTYHKEITVPGWESFWTEQLRLDKRERDLYIELGNQLSTTQGTSDCIHRLLGHADEVQGDMLLECQLASNGVYCGDPSGYKDPRRYLLESGANEWRLLLQVDSDDNAGMMWGDLGRIYYWIRRDALKNRAFDEIWLILQCG